MVRFRYPDTRRVVLGCRDGSHVVVTGGTGEASAAHVAELIQAGSPITVLPSEASPKDSVLCTDLAGLPEPAELPATPDVPQAPEPRPRKRARKA